LLHGKSNIVKSGILWAPKEQTFLLLKITFCSSLNDSDQRGQRFGVKTSPWHILTRRPKTHQKLETDAMFEEKNHFDPTKKNILPVVIPFFDGRE
jgi:hypothetical protein